MRCIHKDVNPVRAEKVMQPSLIERRIVDEEMSAAPLLLLGKELLSVSTDNRRCHVIPCSAETAHDFTPILRSRRRENQSPGSRF